MLCRVALGTQIVEQRINSEVQIIVLLKPMNNPLGDSLIRRSWVRFPPRSKDFFFASCGSLFPFTRTNAQWVIHGFK